MTEAQIAFLCKAAAALPGTENNNELTLLKSYYLMKCTKLTKGYGLPEKQFSSKVRCARCCVEWKNGTQIKVRSIKLSKKQRQRLRSQKASKINKDDIKTRKNLLQSKELEQVCVFCKHSTVSPVLKPDKLYPQTNKSGIVEPVSMSKAIKVESTKINSNITGKGRENVKKKSNVNVYSLSKDVFSLTYKNNTILNAIKEEPKVFKNNKKRKDKYVGLCERAVLASAKLKESKEKQNKLNLFLKPSSG